MVLFSLEDTKVVPINFKTDRRANVQDESGLWDAENAFQVGEEKDIEWLKKVTYRLQLKKSIIIKICSCMFLVYKFKAYTKNA